MTWWYVVIGLLCVAQGAGGQPAFPGAQGFGANARGGRGGAVIEVTSLEDSGPGTLRAACEAAGPRTIVFRVGGTIGVQTPIIVREPYLTIAGQTAPGDGILIRKAKSAVPLAPLCIRTHDVVVRGLRIRTGDSPDKTQSDCLDISSEDETDSVHDIILDHCSFSWSTDENLAIMGRYIGGDNTKAASWKPSNAATRNVTVQWCIISEGLLTTQIKKSRGALIKFIGDCSFHHNLMAHNSSRNPRLQGQRGSLKDVVNTVVYNSPGYGATPSDGVKFNYVGNYFKPGPDTKDRQHCIGGWGQPADCQVYLEGNYHAALRTSEDQEEILVVEPESRRNVVPGRFAVPPVRTTSARQAYEEVLRYAGCIAPCRDSVDERVIEEVRRGTGRIPTSVAEAGGYPQIRGGTPPADADHDGMPDAWEQKQGLSPADPEDRNFDPDGAGYTNLEIYLNSLIPLPA